MWETWGGHGAAPTITMFRLIENGEVFGPEPLGKTSVLLNGGTILKIGAARTPDSSS